MRAYLSFYEPVSRDQLEFSLNYEQAAGAYVALVTLPHEGRWHTDAGTRFGTGSEVPYGASDGTHIVTVRPAVPPAAAPVPTAPLPMAPFLAGLAMASVAWLVGLQLSGLRRQRRTVLPAAASIDGRLSA